MLQFKIRNFFLIISLLALFTMILMVPAGTIRANALDDEDTTEAEETDENGDKDKDKDTEMKKDGIQVKLTSGDFQIEVNAKGQVPYYHFNTSDDVMFFLKFQRMVQFKDENDNDIYDKGEDIGSSLQLTSVDWELDITTDEDAEKEFIFRSTPLKTQEFENTTIELINHFTADSPSLKFDINITNWPFEEGATGLCLEFELIWSDDDSDEINLKKESDDTSIYLKNDDGTLLAYFESASNVTIDEVSIPDGAKLYDTASENAAKVNILLNYPSFNDTLFHDPEIGTSDDAILPVNLSAIATWLIETLKNVKDGFLVVTTIATLFLGALVVLSKRNQKRI